MAIKLARSQSLTHGGNIEEAIKRYSTQHEPWLDMSTGVSPWCWPILKIEDGLWHGLPGSSLTLRNVAAQYYGTDQTRIAITPGSQLAIRLIPQLYEPTSIAVPKLGYQEHAYSWALAGHKASTYHSIDELLALVRKTSISHAVVINPNNPTGEVAKPNQLSELAGYLSGLLFVDEAFSDYSDPHNSAVNLAQNIVALRSLGKFFGLAGARIGFVLANHTLIEQLNTLLEPWSCSGPSQFISQHALADNEWQTMQRKRIAEHERCFKPLLTDLAHRFQITNTVSSGLFHTLFGTKIDIDKIHQSLAKVGIWTRLYNQHDDRYWLRFSLPTCINEFSERINHLNHSVD